MKKNAVWFFALSGIAAAAALVAVNLWRDGPREVAGRRITKAAPKIAARPPAGFPSGGLGSDQPAAIPVFNTTPDLRCRSLGRLSANLYRCGENLVQLKTGAAFPEDLKSVSWPEALAALKERDLMESSFASEAGDITLSAVPNDPKFADQTDLNVSSAYDIGVQDVWNSFTGSPDMIVAVVDSGIDVSHPDLQDNIWVNAAEIPNNGLDDDGNGYIDDTHGYNFHASTADVRDDVGHGTHGAGVIGAIGNNGLGISGINWNVKLMDLKITDSTGKASLAAAVEALQYAAANHARVINASWVMDLSSPDKVALLQTGVQDANDAGAVVVAASGNGFESGGKDIDAAPLYPASFGLPGLISVASVEPDATLSPFSNFGAASVNLAAPGSSVLSTAPGGDYAASKGTSVAATVVSGAAALLLSAKPALTPAEVKSLIVGSAKAQSGLSGKISSGGILSLSGALSSAGISFPKTSSSSPRPESADTSKSAVAPSSGGGCSLWHPLR